MNGETMSGHLGGTLICAITIGVLSTPAPAAWADLGQVPAHFVQFSCVAFPAKLGAGALGKFLEAPNQLLSEHPNGGFILASEVRILVGSSPKALPAMVDLAAKANPAQSAAIGAGLARAVAACVGADPQLLEQVRALVADARNQALLTAFTAALNDFKIGQSPPAAASPPSPSRAAFAIFDAAPSDNQGQTQAQAEGIQSGFTLGGDEATAISPFSFTVGRAGQFTAAQVSPTTP